MSTYLVPQYVHVCATQETTVFLDSRADRYYGLDREQTRALAPLVQGWPTKTSRGEIDGREAEELARDLAQQGLLTQDTARGKSAAPVQLPQVDAKLHEWDGAQWPAIRTGHVGRFATAYVCALASCRLRPLEHAVRRVQRRKAKRVGQQPMDLEAARELTWIFRALRPFFYTTLDRCLLDSLVLVEFLALYDLFPTWVIGVQAMPFAAHSWVQSGRYVLNGPPGFVRAFTPILAI